jgi:uncharacterized membrane protein YqjE
MKQAFKTFVFYMPLAIALMGLMDVVVYWNDPTIRYFAIMATMGWFFHFDSEWNLRKAEAEIDELLGHTDVQS